MPGRRTRRLTPDEAKLWNAVARTMRRTRRPVPPDPSDTPFASAPAGPTRPASPAAPLPPPGPARREPLVRLDPAPDPFAEASAAPPRMDRRRFDRMTRGKLAPEARLDLHGMTRADAHQALIGFVLAAQDRGHRLVLVITGKGRPDTGNAVIPERQGILRHALPHWLAAPPLTGRVIDWRPAHPRHGGSGAVYLYLRRRS